MAQNNSNNSTGTGHSPPDDTIAFGTIGITFADLSVLEDAEGKPKPFSSAIHKIGGISWRMEAHKVVRDKEDKNEPPKLDLYVYCNEDVKDTLWLCKVLFSVHSGLTDPESKLTYSYNYFYGFNTYYWILLDIFDQCNHQKELIVNVDPIEIKLDIKICRAPQKSLPPLDTTLVINFAENRSESFPINKHTLAGLSSYFRNLFFGDWSDNKKSEYYFEINETDDFDMEAFSFMIYSAMTMGWMVHESNFLDYSLSSEILKLAIKYDMAVLIDYCEKFLVDSKNYSKMDLLELAEQYSLNNLKEHCLNEVSMLDYMEDLAKSADIHSRLTKNTQERLNAKLTAKNKEMRNSLAELEDTIRANEQPIVNTMANPFNKLARVLLGQRAMAISNPAVASRTAQ